MKCNFKEIRKITSGDLRSLCIEHNYYNHGTNDEYHCLLDMCKKELTKQVVFDMAQDIFNHSQDAVEKHKKDWGSDDNTVVKHIMFLIVEASYTFYD